MTYDGKIEMPTSYNMLTVDEMYSIDGGSQVGWDILKKIGKKLFDIVFDFAVSKGMDYVWNNRRSIWKKFLNGLKPNEYTKSSPYYKTFSNAIHP